MRIRVVGVGTAFGDDAVGLRVASRLAEEPGLPEGVDAIACERPVDLLDALDGVDAAVLVDATRSGRPPGTVHEPAPRELREARGLSSHGLGVCEALALGRSLGRAPERIAIIGIEVESTTGDGLSPPVRAALDEVTERVRDRCASWSASSAGGTAEGSPGA